MSVGVLLLEQAASANAATHAMDWFVRRMPSVLAVNSCALQQLRHSAACSDEGEPVTFRHLFALSRNSAWDRAAMSTA